MNYLLLALLLTPFAPAWASDAAAPELLKLEQKLTAEQDGRTGGSVSPEQYQAFLDDFRPELTATMSRVPPSSENTATHARILVLLGERDEAVVSLKHALKEAPGDSTLRLSLGHTNLEKKDFARALAEANEVLKADPDNKDAKALKYQSIGRVAPSEGGSTTTSSPTRQKATVAANVGSQVTFTDQAKRKPIAADVPGVVEDRPSPKDGKPLPLWPLAVPIGAGLIGYGIYRNQRTTWGANEPLDTPAELTHEQIAENRRKLKLAALAGGVLLGGAAIATFGPAIVTGAQAFFVSAGPTAGGLVPAYAGYGGGAVAATLNPAAVAAGAKTLGAAVVLVGEAKVASDYYSYSKSQQQSGSSTRQPAEQEAGASSNLKKPSAKDPQLKNTIDRLFRESDQLRGGTAGAVRSEAQTGLATGRKFHTIKAQENINNLQKILRRTNLDHVDRATAEALLSDLQNAIKASVKP